jgi:Ni/Co efflux regulator RcnB
MKRAALGALLTCLVVAGSTAFAGPVMAADGHGHRSHPREQHRPDHRRDNHHRNDRGHHQDSRKGHDNRKWHDSRHHDYRGNHYRHDRRFERGRWHWGTYHRPHGYVHRHWGRGDRLPHAYYASHYVVRDYHLCGLRHPPHGHHWVRVNNDAVLAVIATGVILDVVYNHFW